QARHGGFSRPFVGLACSRGFNRSFERTSAALGPAKAGTTSESAKLAERRGVSGGSRGGLEEDGVLGFAVAAGQMSAAGSGGSERKDRVDDSPRFRSAFDKVNQSAAPLISIITQTVWRALPVLARRMQRVAGFAVEIDGEIGIEWFGEILAGGHRKSVSFA